MAKPATVPQWDSNATNVATPAGGYLTDGWTIGGGARGVAVSSYFNWFMMWAYLWIAWLDGLWDGSGNLTLDTNASVTISGTGKYKRPARVRHYTPAGGIASGGAFLASGSADYWYHGNWDPSAADQVLTVPIDGLQEGERITSIAVEVVKDPTAVFEIDLITTTNSAVGCVGTSAASGASTTGTAGALQTVTLSPNYTVDATQCNIMVSCRVNGVITDGGVANFQVCSISVTTDVP